MTLSYAWDEHSLCTFESLPYKTLNHKNMYYYHSQLIYQPTVQFTKYLPKMYMACIIYKPCSVFYRIYIILSTN